MGEISTDVYNQLRHALVTGELAAGESLREEFLAERFGVSRTPVREALRRLQVEGYIEILPHRGARVLGWRVEDINEVFALRGVLEPHAARQAALRLSESDLVVAQKLADAMERLATERPMGFDDQIASLNNQFHALIVGGSGNYRLSEQVQSIMELARVRATFQRYSAHELNRSMSHHRELLEALAVRDPDWAEAVMKCHIFAARSVYC
ncbi:MAG: GntR family transcriptional regulator [Ferrimicrobium sp.]|uniref:GntR family transcriptional regulator n=1 Tax=Ferrimicrobium sp. TaxID=2926050 RepID=UPI002604FB49|nr:GntR family transcriptional regulator [Ferrimicrobium sp.]